MSRWWGGTVCRAPAPYFQVRLFILLHLQGSSFILLCRFEHVRTRGSPGRLEPTLPSGQPPHQQAISGPSNMPSLAEHQLALSQGLSAKASQIRPGAQDNRVQNKKQKTNKTKETVSPHPSGQPPHQQAISGPSNMPFPPGWNDYVTGRKKRLRKQEILADPHASGVVAHLSAIQQSLSAPLSRPAGPSQAIKDPAAHKPPPAAFQPLPAANKPPPAANKPPPATFQPLPAANKPPPAAAQPSPPKAKLIDPALFPNPQNPPASKSASLPPHPYVNPAWVELKPPVTRRHSPRPGHPAARAYVRELLTASIDDLY